MTTENDKLTREEPAKPTTPGYANDPRAKAADNLEQDNENKLGEHLDDKHDKTGG
jgi:hypothetical protein